MMQYQEKIQHFFLIYVHNSSIIQLFCLYLHSQSERNARHIAQWSLNHHTRKEEQYN